MLSRIQAPREAIRGEAIEIRVAIQHPMETGFRHDESGKPVPANVVNRLSCRYNGVEVFRAELGTGIAANPYLSFFTLADVSGELTFEWADDTGATGSERVIIAVKP